MKSVSRIALHHPPVPVDSTASPSGVLARLTEFFRALQVHIRQWIGKCRVAPQPLAQRHAQVAKADVLRPPTFKAVLAQAVAEAKPVDVFKRAVEAVERPGLQTADRLRRLGQLEADLAGRTDLSAQDRAVCEQDLRQARSRIEPDAASVHQELKALTASLSLQTLNTQVATGLARVSELAELIELSRALDSPARQGLAQALQATRGDLQQLARRDADQAALKSVSPALQRSLAALTPQRYCAARRSLDRVLGVLQDTPRDLVLARLNTLITAADCTVWLDLAARGDVGIIDMLFKGADWDDEALALKLAAVDPQDTRAQLNIDAQHNLRMVSQDLNAFMVERNLHSGMRQLPVSLFQAVKADPAVIRWLTQSAGSVTRERAAQIGAWISLSLYDEATGVVPQEKVDELLRQLHGGGANVDELKPYIRLGFNSTAEIAECRALMQKVARDCQETLLLESLDEKRFPVIAASRLACRLIQEVTGRQTDTPNGLEVDEALAAALDDAMPWVRYEEDLEVARGQLTRELQALGWCPPDVAAPKGANRQWLADPAALSTALEDHDRVRDLLFVDQRIEQSRGEGASPEALADLKAQRDALLRQLAGFDPGSLRRIARSNVSPSIEALRAVAPQIQTLARLPSLHNKVAMLRQLSTPKPEQARQAQAMVERLRQIATLQVALASDDRDFKPNAHARNREGYTGQIAKRLDAMGLSVRRPGTSIKKAVHDTVKAIGKDGRSLAQINEEGAALPVVRQVAKAAGRAWSNLRGRSASGTADRLGGAEVQGGATPLALSEDERRQQAALASFDRQVRALAPGQDMTLRVGSYGTLSVGTPVVPGVSVNSSVTVWRQRGLQIQMEKDGSYLLQIYAGGAVRHGVALEALCESLAVQGYGQAGRKGSVELCYADRESCLAAAERILTGRELEPALLAASRVGRSDSREVAAGVQVSAQANFTVASLSADLAGQLGYATQRTQSLAGEVETQTRSMDLRASASAELASGSAASVGTGVQLQARKRLHWQHRMLREGCDLTLTATVVSGNVSRCVQALLPGLPEDRRQALMASLGETVPDGAEVYVKYRLSPAARRAGNAKLGEASAALTHACLASGAQRQELLDQARERVREAHLITRDPASYEAQGWGCILHETQEVTSSRGLYTRYAEGGSSENRFHPFVPGEAGVGLHEAGQAVRALIP